MSLSGNRDRTICFPFGETEFSKCIYHLLAIQICMNMYFHFVILVIGIAKLLHPLYLYWSVKSIVSHIISYIVISCTAKRGMDRTHIFCCFVANLAFHLIVIINLNLINDSESRLDFVDYLFDDWCWMECSPMIGNHQADSTFQCLSCFSDSLIWMFDYLIVICSRIYFRLICIRSMISYY